MSILKSLRTSLFCTASVAFTACVGIARPGVNSTSSDYGTSALRIYDTKAARFVPFSRLAAAASRVDIVFFGEQHDDPATHAAELAVLASLGERRERVVLSVEMFERDVQVLLNQYLDGSVSEKEFVAGSRPWDRYNTDYRPLVELSRIRGWPVIAANVPRRIAGAVSRQGLAALDAMSATERSYSASQNICPKDAYYKNFAALMGDTPGHGASGAQPSVAELADATAMTDRFYEAQCIKDETMGESVASALARAGTGAIVLHVDGAFHSDFGLGTAERARRRAPTAKTLVLTAVPLMDLSKANGADYTARGDFILFTRAPR